MVDNRYRFFFMSLICGRICRFLKNFRELLSSGFRDILERAENGKWPPVWKIPYGNFHKGEMTSYFEKPIIRGSLELLALAISENSVTEKFLKKRWKTETRTKPICLQHRWKT